MDLNEYEFHFKDADAADSARRNAAAYGLVAELQPARAAGGAVITAKGAPAELNRFTSLVADLGGTNVSRVNRFYVIPADSHLSPEDLVAAAREYGLVARCPDDPDFAGNLQLEVRNQQKHHQDRFADYLEGLGIHHV